MIEDNLEHWASTVHQPLDVLCALTVDIGEEEQLLVPLDHETREVHVTKVVLHPGKVSHQRRQLLVERRGVRGTSDRKIDDEMILSHSALLQLSCHPGRSPRNDTNKAGPAPRSNPRTGLS